MRRLAVKKGLSSCPANDLEVRRISDHEWRVGDGRVDELSADKILGFIQQRGDTFEVFRMGARGSDLVFDAWSAALGAFASLDGEVRNGTKRYRGR
jgi:hypothetical protein